jgi:molybdopterin-guanine dinucleotide biosynthesis protein A
VSSDAPFAVAVLAGGRSSRMGRDKALLELGGRTLLARQVALARELGPAEVWVAGRAQAELAGVDARGIADAVPGAGPMGGLAAVLAATRARHVLLLAVDMPALTAAFLGRVLAARAAGVGVAPRTRRGWEPTAALYPAELAPLAREALAANRLGLHALLDAAAAAGTLRALPVAERDEHLLANWNTPADVGP